MRRPSGDCKWLFAGALSAAQDQLAVSLAQSLKLAPVCGRLLVRRGFNAQSAEHFQGRRLDQMHDPALLPDMAKAVGRIAEAVEKEQSIFLFGDYDADGVTATALMTRFFRVLQSRSRYKFKLESRVPERKHGYGLSNEAVELIRSHKPDLLITLDNGISAHAELAALNASGIDCIVVDHHTVSATLPPALAVINPKRHDNTYPFIELCGAGLAFKLAWALSVHFSQNKRVTPEFRAFLLDAIALAGIGTLADVVPLENENRIIAHHGLLALGRTSMPGLRALIERSNIKNTPPKAHEVAFRIAPRINAAGRCADAADALDLLLTEDPARAALLAEKLDGHNTERQKIEAGILDSARKQAIEFLTKLPGCRSFVLSSPDWHAGVIGIVASRIVEEFHRPALLLSLNAETQIARGSGRSIAALNLHHALSANSERLLTFGGHAAAAGLSIQGAEIAAFRTAFESTAASLISDEDLVPRFFIEEQLTLDEVTEKMIGDLELFEPCGAANPRPTLAAFGVAVSGKPRLFGKEESHFEFFAKQNNAPRRVVAFSQAPQFNALCIAQERGPLDIAFRPQINEFRGQRSVELHLEAFRSSGS